MDRADRIAFAFSRWFIRHRLPNLLAILAATCFFGWKALDLQVFSQFIDLLPRQHPYIQVYESYNRQYGSANVVFAALVAREGSIYDEGFLEKLFSLTDQLDKIEGVDHGQVTSITHRKVRDQGIDENGVLRSTQLVGDGAISLFEAQFATRRAFQRLRERGEPEPPDLEALQARLERRRGELENELAGTASVRLERLQQEDPERAEELRRLRREEAETRLLLLRLTTLPPGYSLEGEDLRGPWGGLVPPEVLRGLPDRVRPNKLAYGRLVSKDETAAIVMAGFLEGRLDYERVFEEVQALKRNLELDGRVEVHLTGMPVLVGWCFHYASEILVIIGLTLGILTILLGFYFRHWYGVVLPLSGAVVSAIWGLGFISLMDYQLEPLVLVIPMLITARAVSHSVQFVERFYEEYEHQGDKHEAVVTSMAHLLLPGSLAIITDALGIYVISICSIELMKKVATFGAFWALSLLVTGMLLNRLLISYFPPPRSTTHYTPAPIARLLGSVGRWATGPRHARGVFAGWLVILVASIALSAQVRVGEARPGSPILWEDSEYNRSAKVVADRFYGADDLIVIVETEQAFGIHRPESMREIEAFQRYMEQDPKVGGTISIVDYLKAITRTFHHDDPRWLSIPYTGQQIGGLLYLYEAGSPDPRVLDPYRDERARTAAIRIFYRDHQGETIRAALDRARRYIRRHPTGRVAIRLDLPDDDLGARVHRVLGPLLPPRHPELVVQIRNENAGGEYTRGVVAHPGRREPPPEDSSAWILTIPRVTKELHEVLVSAGYDSVRKIADAPVEQLARLEGYDLATALQLRDAARLDRRPYTVESAWESDDGRIVAEVRRRGLYEGSELWVQFEGGAFERRASGAWSEGPSFALASGLMGVLAASNEEVERSNNATLIACFAAYFLMILASYRSLGMAVLMITSLGTAALVSMAFMWLTNMGFDVNTLPVQALGVGIGDDYALYIMDRVMRERKRGLDLLPAVRTAIETTGKAIFFTGTTLVGGIVCWVLISSLRFAADMSLLLSVLLVANLIGAILLIPAFTALFRPQYVRVEDPADSDDAP